MFNLRKIVIPDYTSNDNRGIIKFKYYGDFEDMNFIYDDCKNYIKYIGNSTLDGAPVFVYKYRGIEFETSDLKDFKKISISMRRLKLLHYSKKEMTDDEKSQFTFVRYFMNATENLHIKRLLNKEVKCFDEEDNEY